ncbi:MAG: hypothetical protein A2041_10220 [Bacteroidetes bacterium GWA2_31_9b]|nr:MAG: hypothetical protein A2041_10220 [Bacteroidetes bacterium GWA2_31_9b]
MKTKLDSKNGLITILIAEDSPTQAEQLSHILEKNNYKVIAAKDGKEAFAMAIKHKPSIIISDIMMPEMNGYELCKNIKTNENTINIPVILLTSLANADDVLEGLACGADNFITKPYNSDYLITHIERILSNIKFGNYERVRIGVEIIIGGKKRFITADQQQMLSLLISTYDAAVQRNNELLETQEELKALNENLEELVNERTAALLEEIEIRKSAEKEINKLNRIYAVLSNINQAIVRIQDTNKLLNDICLIAVDEGKFESAWIGIINKEVNKIEFSASAGLENELFNVCSDKNPICNPLKFGKHFISNDISNDNRIWDEWKQKSLTYGFKSFAVFPIRTFENIVGSFCIYSNEPGFFDDKEINLLDEMSTDISFALEYIQIELKRKEAEELLKKSELKYRQLFDDDLTGDFIATVDGKILLANPALARIFGYNSVDELMKLNIASLYKNLEERDEFLNFLRKNKKIEQFEREFILRDGRVISTIENVVGEFDENGELVSLKGYLFDNTERKKAELDLIKAKEKAEESDRLKTAFLTNMSHEIRTPMNGILGFTSLLKKPDLTGEKQQDYIQIIEESGARMLNTINDIIDISKIESGLVEVINLETNINEQIEYIYTFFNAEAQEKGLTFLFKNTLPKEEANLIVDKEKLQKILTNLVKNAIKFTDTGSIEFGYNKKDCCYEFFVKDTGIGIPRDKQAVIFERFIQADISDTRAYDGSGLGLSITKAYIEMLGGRIWLESEENKGSTFHFIIPCNIEQKEKNVLSNKIDIRYPDLLIKNLKILIAEDDEISSKYLTEILNESCKEILYAKTGPEAINKSTLNPDIDLILMDVQMPEIDGHEATRQIRKFNKDVVIIAQTAFGLVGDRKKALEAGCNDYISKPIDPNKLNMLIIKNLTLKENWFSQKIGLF